MADKDGGPAFAGRGRLSTDTLPIWNEGLSLRDYFAAAAVTGALTAAVYHAIDQRTKLDFKELARDCYGVADAMLAEREKEQ